jgi:hypothetical protein
MRWRLDQKIVSGDSVALMAPTLVFPNKLGEVIVAHTSATPKNKLSRATVPFHIAKDCASLPGIITLLDSYQRHNKLCASIVHENNSVLASHWIRPSDSRNGPAERFD